jgi:hypothetical protein
MKSVMLILPAKFTISDLSKVIATVSGFSILKNRIIKTSTGSIIATLPENT